MSLRSLIDQAIEKAGSQVKLAEQMKVQQQVISAWRTGRRTCTTAHRIELCKIANYDLKAALLEQVVEGLDENDETQKGAKEMIQAMLDAFPNRS
nr:YdaS family helix-turn-helix protein [Comamonas thiooxydans]